MPLSDAEKALMKKIGDGRKLVIDLRSKARELKKGGDAAAAVRMMNAEYLPAMAQYIASQKEMVDFQRARVLEIAQETESRRRSNTVMLMTGLAVVIALVVGGDAVAGSIHSPAPGPGQRGGRADRGG
jgi:hypothetical protein